MKEFDVWSKLKTVLDNKPQVPFVKEREIWWCSLGLNIGSEEDGKNNLFERPVLIIKKYNKDLVKIIPLTSNTQEGVYKKIVSVDGESQGLLISHIRSVSTKRFSDRFGILDKKQFLEVLKDAFLDLNTTKPTN